MKGFNNLSICLLISFVGLAVCGPKPECVNQYEELWPHPNPNHFWYCHHQGSNAIELPCPAGRGFLRTTAVSGCIPYTDWRCAAKTSRPSCRSDAEYNKPHRHTNPNKFWACPEPQGTPATELNCAPGRGFVDNKKNLGCVPFDVWVCNKADDENRH